MSTKNNRTAVATKAPNVMDAGNGLLYLKVSTDEVAEFAAFKKEKTWFKAKRDSLDKKPKKLFGDIGKAVVTASFKVYGDDVETLRDFVHTMRKRGHTLYTQAQAIHEALTMRFAGVTIEPRPDSIRTVEYYRTANQMIGRAVPQVEKQEQKEERKKKKEKKK